MNCTRTRAAQALHLSICIAVLVLWAGVSLARPPTAVMERLGITPSPSPTDSIRAIQIDLAWLGLLNSPITGREDAETRLAIQRFATSINASNTTSLTGDARRTLRTRARDVERGYEFSRRNIDWVGASAVLPSAILMQPQVNGDDWSGLDFRTYHGARLSFYFDQVSGVSWTAQQAHEAWRKGTNQSAQKADVSVKYLVSASLQDSFVLKYVLDDKRTHIELGQRGPTGWRFLHIRYSSSAEYAMTPVVERVLRGLDLHNAAPPTRDQRRNRLATGNGPDLVGMPDWFRTMTGNGSGSIVSRRGHVLTNHHVVAGCKRVTVNGSPSSILSSDPRLDLALVQSERFANRRPVRFRDDNPNLGEGISVLGYPIFSTSQSINYTRGYVSSTVGYLGDRTLIQITAPVQPGNSGGPVLDASGRQVAVVASKASAWFQSERNVENIAWAIRGQQALNFLKRNGITPIVETRPTSAIGPDVEDVTRWRQITVRIECHKN